MKKVTAVLLLILWSQAASSDEYRSSFGFPFQLPNDWLVLTPKNVSRQYESETIKTLSLEFGDQNNMQTILERVKTGKVEFYFDRKYSTKDFQNNISVQIMPGNHAWNAQEVKNQCSTMSNELRTLYGSSVKIGNCGHGESYGVRYVTYEYFVPQQGVTIVQQEIPYVSNTTVIVAGGSNAAGLANLKVAQHGIVENIAKFVSASLTSAINSIEKAWAYLIETGRSNQWVVIESKRNGRYVQCANMGDFLKCPFPVWNKAIPTAKNTAPKTSRGTPFTEVAGSKMREYISTSDVAVLKKAIRNQGLNPEDVYSQLVDEQDRIVGTSYDVVVILKPSFNRFVQFVQYVLQTVWGGTTNDGYTIKMDS